MRLVFTLATLLSLIFISPALAKWGEVKWHPEPLKVITVGEVITKHVRNNYNNVSEFEMLILYQDELYACTAVFGTPFYKYACTFMYAGTPNNEVF